MGRRAIDGRAGSSDSVSGVMFPKVGGSGGEAEACGVTLNGGAVSGADDAAVNPKESARSHPSMICCRSGPERVICVVEPPLIDDTAYFGLL